MATRLGLMRQTNRPIRDAFLKMAFKKPLCEGDLRINKKMEDDSAFFETPFNILSHKRAAMNEARLQPSVIEIVNKKLQALTGSGNIEELYKKKANDLSYFDVSNLRSAYCTPKPDWKKRPGVEDHMACVVKRCHPLTSPRFDYTQWVAF
ncbi:uncharacterized protein LOC141910003 [Tubulanus polymorphus]|uniref:uncharacterized protein LOC141910003 n=1 Tax=Tubulanus polymorphus TaxID=672921 RepID=UPI003DA503F7